MVPSTDKDILLVFGQKAFCISQIVHVSTELHDHDNSSMCPLAIQTPLKLCFIAKLTELSDWILDAVWLGYKDPSCYRVAFVTAHNAVLVYSMTGDSLSTATYQNEVNCILYPTAYTMSITVQLEILVFGSLPSQLPPKFQRCVYVHIHVHVW